MPNLRELSASLAKTGPQRWLAFLDDVDLDKQLSDDVFDIRRDDDDTYDEYQYETLLSDASSLLDRCLSYRKEYQDLAGAAIRQASEYALFRAQQSASQRIELAEWIGEIKDAEAAKQASVAEKFEATISQNALSSGFAANARGAEALARQSFAAEAIRRGLVNERWAAICAHQTYIESFHGISGHPLNYGERAERIRSFLREDFIEATIKTMAAQLGIKKVFGFHSTNTWRDAQSPLDELVRVVRSLVRAAQRVTQLDQEFRALTVFDLQAPPNSFGQLGKLVPVAPWDARLKSDVFQPNGTGPTEFRTVGIAARIKLKTMQINPNDTRQLSLITASVCVACPYSGPVNLPHVGTLGPEPGDFFTGPGLRNRPPWNDFRTLDCAWFINVSNYSHPDNSLSEKDIYDSVQSIVLYFSVVGSVVPFTTNQVEEHRPNRLMTGH